MGRRRRDGSEPAEPSAKLTRPRVCVTLDPELFKLVSDYHDATLASGIQRWPVDTLRELIWMGINHAPATATFKAFRAAIYNQGQIYVARRMKTFFQQLSKDVGEQLSLMAAEQGLSLEEEIAGGDQA